MTPLSVSGPVKAVAFLVFVAALGGAAYGVQTILGDDVALTSLTAQPARDRLNATEGHTVTFAFNIHNRGAAELPATVQLTGDLSGASETVTVPGGAQSTVFVSVEVPVGTPPGEYALDMSLLSEGGKVARARADAATVRVLEPTAIGYGSGDTAQVLYTGRLTEDGRVFNSNDPFLLPLPFPKTEAYSASSGLLAVREGGVVPGFYEGLVGMQPGESRTISFPEEKGYGPAVVEEPTERLERLEREFELEIRQEQVGRRAFDEFIQQSGQGDPATFAAGDTFVFEQGPNSWVYSIDLIDDEVVDYRLALEENMTFTLYPQWENGSVVVDVDEEHVHFLTTPTTDEGEAFTMLPHWPDMSSVVEITDEEIVVRHDPPVGHKYEVQQGRGLPPRAYTVVSVDEEHIVSSTASTHPLAGKALTFDVLMISMTKA